MKQNAIALSCSRPATLALVAAVSTLPLCIVGCGTNGHPITVSSTPPTQHILFVGDSFTHGRYLPVRTYNNTPTTGGLGNTTASAQVVDENFDTTVEARMESQP